MRKTTLRQTTGMVVVVLVIIAVALGIIRNAVTSQGEKEVAHTHESHSSKGSQAGLGKDVFHNQGCGQCHHTDSTQTKIGPGLKGLFDRKSLPVSGRPVTEENVKGQLKSPYQDMPSFEDRLTAAQRDRILAYLKTL
ncbi:MAG: cytochrome c [Deltaproteobacteria bacterium]|nr:cytochrome c [Deltaproteobacteria bacterium]